MVYRNYAISSEIPVVEILDSNRNFLSSADSSDDMTKVIPKWFKMQELAEHFQITDGGKKGYYGELCGLSAWHAEYVKCITAEDTRQTAMPA